MKLPLAGFTWIFLSDSEPGAAAVVALAIHSGGLAGSRCDEELGLQSDQDADLVSVVGLS